MCLCLIPALGECTPGSPEESSVSRDRRVSGLGTGLTWLLGHTLIPLSASVPPCIVLVPVLIPKKSCVVGGFCLLLSQQLMSSGDTQRPCPPATQHPCPPAAQWPRTVLAGIGLDPPLMTAGGGSGQCAWLDQADTHPQQALRGQTPAAWAWGEPLGLRHGTCERETVGWAPWV